MASTHSLKTPSRSTIRSCVNSKPSTWTFQYIHCVGRMTTFFFAASSDLRIDFGFLFGNQFSVEQLFQLRLDCRRINRREVIAHFFPHEHAVRADVNDAALFEQAVDEFLDLRINQRFAAANGNHRRVAFHRGLQALLQRHHVLERRGIFADAPAAGAGEVAGVQRFELQDHRKLRRLAQLVLDDVAGDFFRQRKWESHNLFYGSNLGGDFRKRTRRIRRRGSAFMKCPAPGRKNQRAKRSCPC